MIDIKESQLIKFYLDFVNTDLTFSEYKKIITESDYGKTKVPSKIDLGPYEAKLLTTTEIEEMFNTFSPPFLAKAEQISKEFSIPFSCKANKDLTLWTRDGVLCVFSLSRKEPQEIFGMVGFERYMSIPNRLSIRWSGKFGREPLLSAKILVAYILFNPEIFAVSSISRRRYKKLKDVPYGTVIKKEDVSEKIWNLNEKLRPQTIYEDDLFKTEIDEFTLPDEKMLVRLTTVENLKKSFSSFEDIVKEAKLI